MKITVKSCASGGAGARELDPSELEWTEAGDLKEGPSKSFGSLDSSFTSTSFSLWAGAVTSLRLGLLI